MEKIDLEYKNKYVGKHKLAKLHEGVHVEKLEHVKPKYPTGWKVKK